MGFGFFFVLFLFILQNATEKLATADLLGSRLLMYVPIKTNSKNEKKKLINYYRNQLTGWNRKNKLLAQ